MVSEQARWVLTNTKKDPLVIAKIFKVPENDCWDYLNRHQAELNKLEEQRDGADMREKAKVWANSLPEAYETKRRVLLERLQTAKTDMEKKERLTHYKLFTGKLQSIPPQKIEQARNYPIKDLLGTNKNIVQCPFHDDKTASLNIKNNFYYCHACNISGDTINFVMKRDNLTFQEAIFKLT